jgi:hypothetical protein
MDGNRVTGSVWLVKAVDRSPSASTAEDLADEILDALDNAALSLTDGTVLFCRRETALSYTEQDGADLWRHVGGYYRLITTP